MFEIFVDSAANIPAELVKAFKIKVLSFVNLVNGKEMTCFDPDLTPEEERQKGKDYYEKLVSSYSPKFISGDSVSRHMYECL